MKLDIDICDKKSVFEYLSKPGNNVNGRLTREIGFKNNFPKLYDEFVIFHTNTEIDNMNFIQKLWYFLQDITEPVRCKYCNTNITPFNGFKYGHQKYCCMSCMNKDDEHKENVNKGIINNFGSFDEYFKVRNLKSEKTCIEKYNVKNAGGYYEFVNKGIKTKIEKYGSLQECYEQSKQKMNDTLIEKYGSLENAHKMISLESRESNKRNHNGLLYMQTEEGKNKVSKNAKETNRNIFLEKIINSDKNVINIDDNNILTCLCYDCNCNDCIEKSFTIPYHIYIDRKNKCLPLCYKKYNRRRKFSKSISKNEKKILDYIRTIYDGVIIENDRIALDGKEIDIYMPDKKIGFEYNGDFWHCNPNIYDDDYVNPITHKTVEEMKVIYNKKIEYANNKNIQLYIIWEHDWMFDCDKIKQKIYDIIINNNNHEE